MNSRLYKKYQEEILPKMQEEFDLKNRMSVPRIQKITLNVGINARNTDKSVADNVENTLIKVSGQKPVFTKARQAISAFKVREGMVVGAKATLRGQKMYDFLDKFININIPRIRDFRGLNSKMVDKQGNLTIGLKESNVFPEIKSDDIERIHGLEVVITTSANDREKGLRLLELFGFPFTKIN